MKESQRGTDTETGGEPTASSDRDNRRFDDEQVNPDIGGFKQIVSDGGERRGRAAPPEDILAAPSNQLETNPHPQDVTEAIVELLDAKETIIDEISSPREQGIDPKDSDVEQLSAVAEALRDGRLSISAEQSRQEDKKSIQTLKNGAREIRRERAIESRTALRIVEDLESIEGREPDQIVEVLGEAVDHLERYRQFRTTLSAVSPREEPKHVGRELSEQFERLDTDHSRRMTEIGETLAEVAEERESCRSEHDQLVDWVEVLCDTASEQTNWSADVSEPDQRFVSLINGLEDGKFWFTDQASSTSGIAAAVDAEDVAQSKPAREFLRVLRNGNSVDDRRINDQIHTAVEAIDRTDTVRTRLGAVDPGSLVRTADRLLSDLETLANPVASHISDRIVEIKETTQQANEADLLMLYAARRELQYYDRTLIPELSEPAEVAGTTGVRPRIDDLDQRRSEMRQSYPSEYPDCDHTIPIYFFDLVSNLLDEAKELDSQGKQEQAAGVADAAEQLLEWIAGLYETHSYFVLLKELRG